VYPLSRNEIRLQYSGFIIFAAKLLSIATGLAFQLMIARTTTTSEYGLWFNLNDLLTYFTLLAAVLPFWAMRFVARGEKGSVKTGIVANIVISTVATAIYLLLIPSITYLLNIPLQYLFLYFLISIQIIELYFLNALQACLRAKVPHTIGYGLLVAEVCKVALGYMFIIRLHQPLFGAIVSLIVAFIIQIVYYITLLREELKQPIEWKYVKEWLKGSAANIYNVTGNQIAAFVFILLFVYGSEEARGYFGAARQIATIITYSSFLAFALYPKLLTDRKTEDVETSLKMVLMFAIPMAAGVLALPDSFLTLLQVTYADAVSVLIVLTIDAFILTLSTFLNFVLFGLEKVDEKATISFRELTKSKLFLVFSLPYFRSLITLPTTFIVLSVYTQNQPLTSALAVGIINLLARFTMFIVLCIVIRKMIRIEIPWKNIAKYTFASIIMAAILFLMPHPTRIMSTLIVTAFGGLIYFALLIIMDKEARALARSVWEEIKLKIR
jgi:O-antigen/teichoic acid export membrane protein